MTMTTAVLPAPATIPDYCSGIRHFGPELPAFAAYGTEPAIGQGSSAIGSPTEPAAVFQTLLAADALRYLTLQVTANKASGHPGGFASVADAVAALIMLGQKNVVVATGHHAPGFYSALFLDRSLEAMGICDVQALSDRFREEGGLPGHVSGSIPGLLNPAGPLGQGQHFAMAAALLHRQTLFPVILGDGECDEPYVANSIARFHSAYPSVTNFLPVLVWNGYSQEHHSTLSTMSNRDMVTYWRSHGFAHVIVVDAKDSDDRDQPGAFVDSTRCSFQKRLKYTEAVLTAVSTAASAALRGSLTMLVIKQVKGAGLHASGAKSHCLSPQHTVDHPEIVGALRARALHPAAWALVRTNFERAGGGPAATTVVTETPLPLPPLGDLPLESYPLHAEHRVATTAVGRLIAHVGEHDHRFIVSCADGNEASGMTNVNRALQIAHPIRDALYNQGPGGQVYEPINEDACAGLAAGLSLLGGRAVWCSYESFAVNGLPVWQTVTQAMAELRRATPSAIALFTAGALEQGRNGWTHQRPEIEAYLASLMRNGNVFPLFPPDANSAQVCYQWALATSNKGIAITASKSPLPVRTTFDQCESALRDGAVVLEETAGVSTVVFAVIGDIVLSSVYEAAARLRSHGVGSKIVAVISPRRLYRPRDVAWERCAEADGGFLDDDGFERLFGGAALIGVTGGASAMLEPVMLRSALKRDTFCWKRGRTTRDAGRLMAINGLTTDAFVQRALTLVGSQT